MTLVNGTEKIAIFLDTNILMKNFRMDSNKFLDLLSFCESLDDRCNLCITEMNRHETVEHFSRKIDEIYNSISKLNRDFNRISEINPTIEPTQTRENLQQNLATNLNSNFTVISPSHEATANVFSRYYNGLKPFENSKKEFKDALIWETIHEYALENIDTVVYFVSENHTDFAVVIEEAFQLHEDYDSENGRIIYKQSFDSLLETLEVIRPLYGLLNQNIINVIDSYFEDYYNVEDLLIEPVSEFLSDQNFDGDWISGWGIDPSDFTISSYEIDSNETYESNSYLYIPMQMTLNLNFSIETINPVYERGDEEFISEPDHSCDLLIYFVISFNIEEQIISAFEDLTIEFL